MASGSRSRTSSSLIGRLLISSPPSGLLPPARAMRSLGPAQSPRRDHRLGPPLDQDLRPLGLLARGRRRLELATHRVRHVARSLRHAQPLADVPDVAVHVLERHRLGRDVGETRRLELCDHALVPWHGERREHEIGLERRYPLDVGREVGADARQSRHHLRGIVGMVVDADQEVGATEGTHDLGVRARERDDAHDDECNAGSGRRRRSWACYDPRAHERVRPHARPGGPTTATSRTAARSGCAWSRPAAASPSCACPTTASWSAIRPPECCTAA